MYRSLSLIGFVLFVLLFTGCNTLVNVRTINIEIAVPAKVRMPENFRTAAIRYNNCNVAPNPFFSDYIRDDNSYADTTNLDSIASKVYFQSFVETLKNQFFFDSIAEIESFDYSEFKISDPYELTNVLKSDSSGLENMLHSEFAFPVLAVLIKSFQSPDSTVKKTKVINPEFGLYSKQELQQIADSTGSDILFSLDYFAATDGIKFSTNKYLAIEAVYIIPFWNVYDLQKQKLLFFYNKTDTIGWKREMNNNTGFIKNLPKRKDAVLNAAEIAGSGFAEFLVPHWKEVQRMYYKSGNVELSKTEELIEKGEWLKAAEIWKANIGNKNKKIAAKSMFNLALACEMEGNLDAAIDWAVKSFQILEQKNVIHSQNCREYIHILGQRKLDIKIINRQMNVEMPDSPINKDE